MSSSISQDILGSVDDLQNLLSSYNSLLEGTAVNEPNKIELAALGTILHSFYNGIEGVFLLVAKHIDQNVPTGHAWHQSLLNSMTETTKMRPPLILPETADSLAAYLKFRHYFRHAYAFMLNWKQMEPLVIGLLPIWGTVKNELIAFASSVQTTN